MKFVLLICFIQKFIKVKLISCFAKIFLRLLFLKIF